jgi:hypothetical protein
MKARHDAESYNPNEVLAADESRIGARLSLSGIPLHLAALSLIAAASLLDNRIVLD